MNRARLRELGFELSARAGAGESDEGAWFATAPDGASVVLKWFPDETVADRYAVLLPGLDELRSRGVPVPEYPPWSSSLARSDPNCRDSDALPKRSVEPVAI